MKKNTKTYDQEEKRRKNKSKKRPLGRPEYLTERDCKILNYLWRWKVASTASVHEMINRPASIYSTYKILNKLERSGFIKSQRDWAGPFFVWLLSDQGFLVVKKTIVPLFEDNYLSNDHNHDRLVQAFQLGEWATHQLPNVKFFTQQELQRIDRADFPEWVPTSHEHKPDGYTKIDGAKKTYLLSFEVELVQKNLMKYEAIIRFYKDERKINRVYWLVDHPMIQTQILKAKANVHDESFNYHVFVDLEEFKKHGWDTWITNERSEKVHTIRENMQEIYGDKSRETLAITRDQSTVHVHLNNLKVLGRTKS